MEGCQLLLVAKNPGITRKELEAALSMVYGVASFSVLRGASRGRLIHLSIAIVNFVSSDDAENAINSNSIHGFHLSRMDTFFNNPNISIILGLPQIPDRESYIKTFKEFGAHECRLLDGGYSGYGPIVAFSFKSSEDQISFGSNIDGCVVSGRQISVSPLIVGSRVNYKSSIQPLIDNKDFTIVHKGKEYKCWKGSAASLSYALSKAIKNDPCVSSFEAPPIPGPFSTIIDFFDGKPIQITPRICPFLLRMSEFFQIKRLFHKADEIISGSTDVLACLEMLPGLSDLRMSYKRQISIVASNFKSLCDTPQFMSLSIPLTLEVISMPSFQQIDENFLFRWVLKFMSIDIGKFRTLIKEIRIDRLNNNNLDLFVSNPFIDLNEFRGGFLQIGFQMAFPEH